MDTKLLLSLFTSLLLLPHGQLSPSTDWGGTVNSINQQYYRKRDDNVKVTPLSTTTTSSTTFCASLCSQQPSCRYFRWSPASNQCILFRLPTRNETGVVQTGLTEKQRCTGSRTESQKGVCVCSNGRSGPSCDVPFEYDLQLIAQVSVYNARAVEQSESAYYGSMVAVTSFRPQPPTGEYTEFTRVFNCSRGSQTYSAHGGESRFDWLTSASAFTAFDTAYLFVTTYNSSNSSNPTPSQMLMNGNTPEVLPSVIQSWPDLAVSSSTVFRRSTGDIHLCYTVDDVPGSSPGMKLFQFNAATERLDLQFTTADSGSHRQCAFVDIDGTLFALSDSPAKHVTTLYYLSGNHTWQPHSNITGPGNLSGLSVAFSTQANTHMLAFGHAALQRVSVYLWRNQSFVPTTSVNVTFTVEFPYLVEVGYRMYLLLSYAQPTTTSQLYTFKFNCTSTTFDLFGTKSPSYPSGGFTHFWFDDYLYLVVLNRLDVWKNASDSAYTSGYQQIFRVV